MGTTAADSKTPAMIAFLMIAGGIIIAAVQGLLHGSIAGGILAGAGAIPGCYGMWKGIQAETQTTLAISVTSVLAALVVGAILIVLGLVHGVHTLMQ